LFGGRAIDKQQRGAVEDVETASDAGPRANGKSRGRGHSGRERERLTRTPPTPNGHAGGHHHHHLIEIPEIEVETGQTPIPPDERATIEAEAPMMAEPVEEVAEDRKWLSHKLLNARTLISFALAIGLIIFLFTRINVDPARIWATMLTASPLLLLAGFVVYYAAFWIRAARWRLLLQNAGLQRNSIQLPSNTGLVEIIYLSWFVNCIVPAKLGDAYRSYLLKRNSGISFSSTIGTILAERVVDLLILFGLLLASFTLVQSQLSASRDFPLELVMLLGAGMVGVLIIALVGLRFFSGHVIRLVPTRFKGKFAQFRQGILRSFKRRSLPTLLSYTVAIWLFEAGRLFFVTRALDAHAVTLSAVIFIALLSSLLTTLPLTPGGVGVVEGAVTVALGLFLNDPTLALSIALLDRLINYWSLVVGGFVLYLVSKRR
jgi:glycosyltransferase 2 family protein